MLLLEGESPDKPVRVEVDYNCLMNWKTGILLGIALLVAGLLLGWLLLPRVDSTFPDPGEIQGRQTLQVSFNRPMDPASVEEHLSLSPDYDGEISWDEDHRIITFTPLRIWPSGGTVTLQIGRGSKSRLRLPLLRELQVNWPVSPTSLVYLWPADGVSNLYKINPVNGESEALTDLTAGVLAYSISPDRESIIFSTPGESGTSQIIFLDPGSEEETRIINCQDGLCTAPQLSADGNWLAFEFISDQPESKPGVRVYSIPEQTYRDLGSPDEYLEKPLWSPAGWLAYYNQTHKGYQFWNPISDKTLFLANDTGGDGSWSADGRYFLTSEILFVSETLAPRHLQLFDLVEKNSRDLTQGNFLEDLNPSFAPQGLRFAFSRKSLKPQEWTPGRQLWVMDLDSGETFPLTEEVDYQHTSFAWHPDGERLAYVRYNQAALSEPPEIWLIESSGEDALRLIINGFAPGWIP